MLENVPSGSYITTVTATDKDSGLNGEIKYSFGSGDTDGFRIDSVLGKFVEPMFGVWIFVGFISLVFCLKSWNLDFTKCM